MSLIDEALRRARQDVARQDAAHRHAYPAMPAQVRGTGSGSRLLLVGLLGGAIIAGIAFGGAYWLFGRRPAPPVIEAQVSPPETPAAPPPVYSAPPVEPTEPVDVAPPTVSLPPARTPTVTPLTARQTAPPAPPTSPTIAPEPAPAPAVPETPPAPPAAAPSVFYREAPLPGGGKLELRGIAFSGTQPTALINDRVLVAGESVEGFTLVRIEPKRVELQGQDGTIILSLQQ